MTVSALRDTAEQAGVPTQGIHIRDIGWDKRLGAFVDRAGAPMQTIFKLYPWEWILSDPFGSAALETLGRTQWIEPIWKMLLSNKGILPILWELYPGHPYLLETYFDHPHGMEQYVRKPLLSREGANITLHDSSGVIETGGPYGAGRCVYQALGPVPCFEGARPVVGSWVIGDESCGIGIRESDGPITDNLSRFVPHVFEPRPT